MSSAASSSQGFGTLLHDVARHIVDAGVTDIAELEGRLDAYWQEIDWEAPVVRWRGSGLRPRRRWARLLRWHRESPYEVVGAEVDFDLEVPLAAGVARVRGQIDRLERDGVGRGHVVDYKTGRSAPGVKDAQESPQLGLYQLAVLSGAVDTAEGTAPFSGTAGATLLPLRKGPPREQPPLEVDSAGRSWVHELLEGLVAAIAAEDFPARRNAGCDHCPVRRCCPAQPEGAQVA